MEERIAELEDRLVVLERRFNFAQYVKTRDMTAAEVVLEWLKHHKTVRGSTLAIETDNLYTAQAYRQAIWRLAENQIIFRTRIAGLYVLNKQAPPPKPEHGFDVEAAHRDWEHGMAIRSIARKYGVHYTTVRKRLGLATN